MRKKNDNNYMTRMNRELVWIRGDNVNDLFLVDVNDKEVTFPFFEPVCAGFPSPATDYEESYLIHGII